MMARPSPHAAEAAREPLRDAADTALRLMACVQDALPAGAPVPREVVDHLIGMVEATLRAGLEGGAR